MVILSPVVSPPSFTGTFRVTVPCEGLIVTVSMPSTCAPLLTRVNMYDTPTLSVPVTLTVSGVPMSTVLLTPADSANFTTGRSTSSSAFVPDCVGRRESQLAATTTAKASAANRGA